MKTGRPKISMIGNKYGRLTVVSIAHQSKNRQFYYHSICDCGAKVVASGNHVRRGGTKSCGCLQKELVAARMKIAAKIHGQCKSLTYSSWRSMLGRCYCPAINDYHRYGGKGIAVCLGMKKFTSFLEAMGHRPSKSHSIDRIKGEHGYSCGKCSECASKSLPPNCRWSTSSEQANNRSDTVRFTLHGEETTLQAACKKHNIPQHILRPRIKSGMNPEEAISKPFAKRRSRSAGNDNR